MKKTSLTLILLLLIITIAACGNQDDNAKKDSEEKEETNEQTDTESDVSGETASGLAELGENATCEYCNMKIYEKEHDMGMFSAQGITEEGENLFFDDVGCMLNQERMDNIILEKFVRDYHTLKWIKLEEAVVVKAEINTPMHYGYAFFENKEEGQKFIDDLGTEKANFSTVSNIDEVSGHRHIEKMEKMKSGEGKSHQDMDSEESEDMNGDMNNDNK